MVVKPKSSAEISEISEIPTSKQGSKGPSGRIERKRLARPDDNETAVTHNSKKRSTVKNQPPPKNLSKVHQLNPSIIIIIIIQIWSCEMKHGLHVHGMTRPTWSAGQLASQISRRFGPKLGAWWNLLQPLHLVHLWLMRNGMTWDDLGWNGMKWVRPRSSKKPLLDYWPGPTNSVLFFDVWRKNDPARSRTEAFCKCASGARGAKIGNLWIN